MFKLLITVLFILQWSSVMAEDTIIQVTNIEPERGGNIMIFIFGKEGYPKKHDDALLSQAVKATASEMTFKFALKLDEIAVKILHDEDENGKVNKNRFGIYPAEGLGFSKGQRVGTFGPPKYKKSKVTKAEYLKGLTIQIRYP